MQLSLNIHMQNSQKKEIEEFGLICSSIYKDGEVNVYVISPFSDSIARIDDVYNSISQNQESIDQRHGISISNGCRMDPKGIGCNFPFDFNFRVSFDSFYPEFGFDDGSFVFVSTSGRTKSE